MDAAKRLEEIRDLVARLGIEVREEHLGGESGGLCTLRGRHVLFIDLDADAAVRLERAVQTLRVLPGIDGVYVAPALRELIDRGGDGE